MGSGMKSSVCDLVDVSGISDVQQFGLGKKGGGVRGRRGGGVLLKVEGTEEQEEEGGNAQRPGG